MLQQHPSKKNIGRAVFMDLSDIFEKTFVEPF